MTGSSTDPEMDNFLAEHSDRVLYKPFDGKKLQAALALPLPHK